MKTPLFAGENHHSCACCLSNIHFWGENPIFRCFNGLRIVDTSHQLGAARARHGQPAGWRRLWSKAPQSTTSWLRQKAVLRSCWFQQTLWGFAVYQWIGFLGKILTGKPWFLPSN